MNAPGQQPDLNHLLRLLWRRKWIVVACTLILPVATYVVSSTIEKTYESSVTIQVQPSQVDTTLFEGGSSPQVGAITAVARLIQTTSFAKAAARRLDPPSKDPRVLLDDISVTPEEEEGFIELTATNADPKRAADVANAFAEATVASRSNQARKRVSRAIAVLSSEFRKDRGTETSREQLSQELQRLRALRASQGNNAQIVESATVADSPVSPKPLRNTVLALVLGLVVGVGFALLRERLDLRIRSPHQLEEFTGLPLLSSVPGSAFPDQASSGADGEAFQTLRASLTYFNVDRPLQTIIVASPLKGDGKTTVATYLSISLARAGKDVILADCDLRRPQVAARLGVGTEGGVGSVLAGETTVAEELIDFHVVADGTLRVLPAGPAPPNPSELLSSERAHSLLRELNEKADIVVIDSSPILPVSDILPLIRQASGVLAVTRLGKATRDSLRRFLEVVGMAGGTVLGLVATDARAAGLYDGYGYGYGYGGYGPYHADERSENGERRPLREPSSPS
jgi:capsular exopolysaccharide synthesis family protein